MVTDPFNTMHSLPELSHSLSSLRGSWGSHSTQEQREFWGGGHAGGICGVGSGL